MTPAEADAATFTGRLWAAIRAAGGPHAPGHACRHFPRAYDTAWLTSLPLPGQASRPPVQPVALLDDRHAEFERHTDPGTLAAAYASYPRTQVLEDIAASQAGTWYWLTALHLTRLSRSDPHVTCSVFTSRTGDQTFGAHRDTWYGAVVQIDGAQRLADRRRAPGQHPGTGPDNHHASRGRPADAQVPAAHRHHPAQPRAFGAPGVRDLPRPTQPGAR